MYAYQLVQYVAVRDMVLGEDSPFSIAELHEDISALDDDIKAIDFIKNYDLSRLLSPNVIDTTFSCHFFPGNLAWMSQQDGHYRYFSRNYKGHLASYDVLDFLYAYYETENIGKIISLLSNKAGVIFLDKRWKRMQEHKYLQNMKWMDSLKERSPLAHKALGPHREVYRFLNEEGFRHLGPMNLSVGRDAIFFSSARYMGERLNMSASKISRVCIYLEALGLIKRVEDEKIPEQYLEKALELKGRKKRVNYYCISDTERYQEDILRVCEEFALSGVRYSNMKN